MLNAKRRKLVEEHMKVVTAIARQMMRTSQFPEFIRLDDLISFGYMGLVDAALRFDSKQGVSFGAFASQRVKGAIYDELRKTDFFPRGIRKQRELLGKGVSIRSISPADTSSRVAKGAPALDAAVTRERVQEILSLVPHEHRDIFERYFLKHERMADIGRRLGRSESRISQRLKLAIHEVRKRLCPQMMGDKTPLGWHNKRASLRA